MTPPWAAWTSAESDPIGWRDMAHRGAAPDRRECVTPNTVTLFPAPHRGVRVPLAGGSRGGVWLR